MPPSTLDYWVRTGLVQPSIRRSEGKRVERWWTIREVVVVRTLRALRQAGAPLGQLRKAKRAITDLDEPIDGAHLHWDGSEIVIVRSTGALESAARPGQQMLLSVTIPIGDWAVEAVELAEVVDLDEFKQAAIERRKRRRKHVVPTIRAELR